MPRGRHHLQGGIGLVRGLPRNSTQQDRTCQTKTPKQQICNRRIGEFLKELDLTEGRSTGIPKILKVMKENGSPPPEFETDEDRTSFLIRLPVHERAAQGLAGEVTPQVTGEPGTKLALSRHQVDILRKCFENKAITDLMAITGRADRTKFRDQVLNPLLEEGLVEMTIPDKPRSSKQRYRLTDKGRQVLEDLGETE